MEMMCVEERCHVFFFSTIAVGTRFSEKAKERRNAHHTDTAGFPAALQ